MSESLAKQRSMIDLDEFERRLHRPAATTTRSDEDPLAELARLVSGNEDPYGAMFAASRAPAVQSPTTESYAPPKNHPLAGDFAAIEAGLLRGTLPQDESWAANADAYPAADAYGEAPAEQAWGPAYGQKPRSRKPLILTSSVIVLGLVGIGASFALKGHVSGSREIATIEAAPGPTKIQPDTPEVADSPRDSASILDKSPRPAAVALSNSQEQPVDLSRLPPKPKVLSVGNAPLTGAALSDQQAATAAVTPTPAQQPMTIAALIEPKKVRTVSVRPDGTVLSNDPAPAPAAAKPTSAAATSTPAAKPATPKTTARVAPTTPAQHAASSATDAGAPLALSGAKPHAATKPVAVAKAEVDDDAAPAPAATAGGGFAVQLAAPGSEHDAKEAATKLGSKYSAALGGHRPTIRKATVGTHDVYRVRVVNLSREEASALCQKLQAGGGTCFVAKN